MPLREIVGRAVHIDEGGIFAGVAEVGAGAEFFIVMLGALRQTEVVLIEEVEELAFEAGVAEAFQAGEASPAALRQAATKFGPRK